MGGLRAAGQPPAAERFRTITFLTYHAIPHLAQFETDLDYYQEWNYTTVTCDGIADHLDGLSTLPPKPLLVTFDDGYATQYAAAPELTSRGMKGVFYVTTDWIDGTPRRSSLASPRRPR